MAVRRPLYNDGNNLREMTSAMITAIQSRCVFLFAGNPSVNLAVVGSGGSVGSMSDTRLQAGVAQESSGDGDTTHADAGDFPATSGAPQITPIVFDKINQVNASLSAPTDTDNRLYPAYYDGSGAIQAMTATDMFDTFITQAIDDLVGNHVEKHGTFKIFSTSSESGHTLISATPVFTDTRANTAAYAAGSIPETRDQPHDIQSFFLHYTDQTGTAPAIQNPVKIDSSNNIISYEKPAFDAILAAEIRHHAVNTTGARITYNINGAGNNRGTGMVDTRLDNASRQTRIVGSAGHASTVYRAQDFPAGSNQTVNTYFLRITRS